MEEKKTKKRANKKDIIAVDNVQEQEKKLKPKTVAKKYENVETFQEKLKRKIKENPDMKFGEFSAEEKLFLANEVLTNQVEIEMSDEGTPPSFGQKIKNHFKSPDRFYFKIARGAKKVASAFKPANLKKFFSKETFNKENFKRLFTKESVLNFFFYLSLIVLALIFLTPFYFVVISAFKTKNQIIFDPIIANGSFSTFVDNVKSGFELTEFFKAFCNTLIMTSISTVLILLFSSAAAWMIVRIKSKFTKILYYTFVLSMIVPFPLLMNPMILVVSNYLHISNIFTIAFVYVGFGAGLSVFMFTGFIKSIPAEIEEAALMDGCNPIRTFFFVVCPILKPTFITVGILNIMWIWNDYLLPVKILSGSDFTIPITIQKHLIGSYGSVLTDKMMAVVLFAILPVIIFYLLLQKYIIKGVSDGAVKS